MAFLREQIWGSVCLSTCQSQPARHYVRWRRHRVWGVFLSILGWIVLLLAPAANKQLQSSEKFVSGSRGLDCACTVDSNSWLRIHDLCESWDQTWAETLKYPWRDWLYKKAKSLDIEREDCDSWNLDNHAITMEGKVTAYLGTLWATTEEPLDDPTLVIETLWHSVVIFFRRESTVKTSQIIDRVIVVFDTTIIVILKEYNHASHSRMKGHHTLMPIFHDCL